MEPVLNAFYDNLADVASKLEAVATIRDFVSVSREVHSVMLLFDCIQRTIDQNFVQSIVKDASVDVATDVANS